MQALTVELLNERKYSAILDDLNRFREVCKLVTPWGPPGHLDSSNAHVAFMPLNRVLSRKSIPFI